MGVSSFPPTFLCCRCGELNRRSSDYRSTLSNLCASTHPQSYRAHYIHEGTEMFSNSPSSPSHKTPAARCRSDSWQEEEKRNLSGDVSPASAVYQPGAWHQVTPGSEAGGCGSAPPELPPAANRDNHQVFHQNQSGSTKPLGPIYLIIINITGRFK